MLMHRTGTSKWMSSIVWSTWFVFKGFLMAPKASLQSANVFFCGRSPKKHLLILCRTLPCMSVLSVTSILKYDVTTVSGSTCDCWIHTPTHTSSVPYVCYSVSLSTCTAGTATLCRPRNNTHNDTHSQVTSKWLSHPCNWTQPVQCDVREP